MINFVQYSLVKLHEYTWSQFLKQIKIFIFIIDWGFLGTLNRNTVRIRYNTPPPPRPQKQLILAPHPGKIQIRAFMTSSLSVSILLAFAAGRRHTGGSRPDVPRGRFPALPQWVSVRLRLLNHIVSLKYFKRLVCHTCNHCLKER